MRIFNTNYTEIDKDTEKLVESDEYVDLIEDTVITNEFIGDDVIIIDGIAWRVLDKGLIFAEGVYYEPEEGSEEYTPSWSVTLLYNDVSDEEFNPQEFVYFEEGTPACAIRNYEVIKCGKF